LRFLPQPAERGDDPIKVNRIIAVTLLLACFSFGFKGCGAKDVGPYLHAGLAGLKDARAIFIGNGVSTKKLDLAIQTGEVALAAFDAGGTNTVELIANFITVFESVVSDASLISNPQTRTKILVMLSIADVALHTVAEILKNEEPKPSNAVFRGAVSRDSRDAILAFDKKPKFRCRSSVSGRFVKMEVCKAHPDITVVEVP
jgi:hypothetical protein